MAQSYEDGLTQSFENLTGDGLEDLSITASDNLPDTVTPSLDLGGLAEMGMLPTVSSVTTSVNVMGDDGVLDRSDIGLSSFTISITFDQAMNTSVLPVISFPTLGENPGALLTFSGFVWSNGNQTYSATFTVNDIELEVADLDVQISDARNNAGETMASVTITDVFSIDTDADVGDDLSITFNDGNGFIDSSEDISAVDFSVAGLDSGSTAVATFTGLDNMGMVLSTTVNISANGALSVDLTGFAQGTVTASIMTTDAAGNTTSGAGDSSIIDSSADLDGNLSLSVNTIAVNGADSGMIAFDVSGLDGDLTSATVTFSDGDTDVVVDVSGGDGSYMADISGLSDGNITSTLNVTDGADNTASDTGANIAMDRTADEGGDLALTISDTVINEDEAGSVSFDIAGLDADIATAVVTFTDGVDSVTVDVSGGNGTYSADLSMLSDGTITSSLAVTDNAGNTAGDTGADITLDTMDPNAPIVTGITDDTGSSATDGITSDDDLTISGTAEANSSVDVYVDGELLGTVMANNFGDWSIVFNTVPMPPPYGSEFVAHLPDGTYSITATATDAAGNVSATSSAFTIMVDTMDPNAPVISTSITNDAGVSDADGTTTDATPTLTITAEAGTSVEVFIDGISAGFATETMTAGTFTFTPAMALAADVYNFTAISTDAAGNDSAASAAVSLTITDAPIINGLTDSANMVTMDGLNDGVGTAVDGDAPANATASGTIAFEDFAAGQTHSVTAILPPAGAFGSFSASLTNSATDDGLGEVTWTFSVANSDIDHLDAGDTITQNYTVRITDDMGNETEQAITVIILGTDDAAVITADETGAVSEGDIGDPAVTATGSIAVSDADDDDTPSFANAADTGLYGSIVVNATGDGWTYTLDQSTVQDLDDMEVVTDTLTLIDDEGNEVDIVITITGTDDAAIITGDVTGTVTEGNIGDAAVTATGAIGVSDVDGDDDPSFANASAMGLYGMLVVNSAGDEWTYTLDQSTVQDLDDYDMVTDTVTLTDDEGNTRDIVITIIGTADDAVITADTTGAVNEGDIGDIVTATGAIAVSDLDDDDMPSFANATDTGLYGSISVNSAGDQWTYTLDQASVQDLNAGDMIVDTVTLIDDEGNMVDIDITITGTNDGPVITTPMGGNEGAVTEDAPVVADLTPLPVGTDIQVNTTTTGSQQYSSVTALADGGFIVAWEDRSGADGSGFGIYGQRYDATGSAAGAEFQINTETNSNQLYLSTTALNDGGFVVSWSSTLQDGSGHGVYAQRYDDMGAAVGVEFLVNTETSNEQNYSEVTGLNDGGFIVTWSSSSNQDGSGWGIFGQRYDAMGATVGTEFQVNTVTAGNQLYTDATALNDGGFVVTWEDQNGQDGSAIGIYGQRYDAMGAAVGAEFLINTTTLDAQRFSSVTSLDDGGFVVTWESPDGSLEGIYGQRYDATGAAVGLEFQVNTTTVGSQLRPGVTALNDGGFVVTWSSDVQDGSGYGIYGQRFDAMGAAIGTEFLINDITAGQQFSEGFSGITMVDTLVDGRLVVTWSGFGTEEVFTRIIDVPVAGPTTNSTTGQITADDADSGSVLTFTGDAVGTYGAFVIDSVTGEWTFTLDEMDPDTDALTEGQIVTETFTVTVTDDQMATTTQDVTITITGTNDGPVASDVTIADLNEGDSASITLGGMSLAIADLASDVDSVLAADSFAFTSVTIDGVTTTLTDAGISYDPMTGEISINADVAAYDSLAVGDSAEIIISYDVTDDFMASDSGTITFNVNGTNDGPVITTPMGGNEGAVTEDTPFVPDFTPLPTGMDILVNTTTTGRQTQTSIAALADGGFVVTFTDNSGEDGDGQGVFGQRFDAMGVAVGAEFQVNTTTTGTQEGSSVTALADGGFVVTFTDQSGADGSGWGVFGQRFDSMGVAVGTEFQVNTATTVSQFDSTVTALADGGFVVTFSDQSGADGDGFGVLGQRYDAMGMTVGTEFVVNTTMTSFQNSSSVAALADGGFVVTFTDSSGADGDGNGVLGQRFDAMGVAVGAEFVVNTTTVSSQSSSNVTALADGGFVVTFTDSSGADGDGQGVFGQRFDAMGVAVGNEFQVNTTINNAQSQSNVTALSDGGFVVTFTDNSRADGSQTGIFGQRFDAMGMAVGNEFLINDTTAGRQIASSVVELADGRLAVTFYGDETGSNNDVFVRLIDMPVAGPITNSTTGQITADDVDAGAALTFTGDATGTYGAFVIDSMTGEWTFTLDEMDPDTNALTEGQIVTETFTVTVTDDQMATTTQDVTITITGTNDAATITASMMEDTSVTEAGGDNPGGTLGDPDAGGTLSVSDVDTGEDVFEAVMAAELVGDYGTFTFDEMTGAWTYILDNNNATVQALSDGDMLTDTLTVSSLDGTDSFDIDVTINGVNDAAIVVAPSDLSGNVTELPDGDANENTGTVSTSGTILFDDETADTHNVTFTAVTGPGTVGDVVDYIGTFSSNFTQDSTGLLTGQIDWTFTVDDALLDSLGDGETLTQLYEYTITDNNGAVLTQIVTITITGSNDAATVSGLSSDTVDEFAANGTVVGTVVLTDVDSSGGPVSYALTDDADGRFAINATTGEITVADSLALDFEQNISHFITVEVTEGSETSMQIVEINVTDVNGPEIIIADDLGRTLIGDDFNDNFTGGLGADIFIGGGGDDILSGGGGSDILDGGDGMDTLSGGAGADRFIGGDGADSHDGGGGFDTLDYSGASSAVHLNLISGGTLGDAAGDSYVSIENVDGSDFDDIITGSSGANVINGNDGNDRLFGEAGNDRLFGGDGVDRLDGGEGNDILSGGLGVDIFFGGAGADLHLGGAGVDTIDYRAASSAIVVNLSTGGTMGDAAGDTFFGVERVLGSENFNDHITGGSTSDNLHGRGGDDYIHGGSSGNDSLFGQGGVDSFGYDTGTGRRDIINDFEAGALNNEVVYILGGDPNFDSFAEIMAVATDVGGNVVFDFGGGNRLTFIGLQAADFDIGDFDFSGTPPPAGPPPGGNENLELAEEIFVDDVAMSMDMDALI